jgi:hypothetical protein
MSYTLSSIPGTPMTPNHEAMNELFSRPGDNGHTHLFSLNMNFSNEDGDANLGKRPRDDGPVTRSNTRSTSVLPMFGNYDMSTSSASVVSGVATSHATQSVSTAASSYSTASSSVTSYRNALSTAPVPAFGSPSPQIPAYGVCHVVSVTVLTAQN